MWGSLTLAAILAAVLFVTLAATADADHREKLPLIPNTPAIASIWEDGVITYAFDARAAAYPGFVEQVRTVDEAHFAKFGIRLIQVAPNQNPEILHTMPDSVACNGCSANVSYHLKTVIVRYVYQLGYQDWKTAISHEQGHIWGLHEMYFDSNGVIQCNPLATWTIMSCATGTWVPQLYDYTTAWKWLTANRLEDGEAQYGRGVHSNGQNFIWLCNARDGRTPPIHQAVDRIAVMYWTWNGGSPTYAWAGYHLDVPNAGSCVGANVPPSLAGSCYNIHVNQEISGWVTSWQRSDMRNDQAIARICP